MYRSGWAAFALLAIIGLRFFSVRGERTVPEPAPIVMKEAPVPSVHHEETTWLGDDGALEHREVPPKLAEAKPKTTKARLAKAPASAAPAPVLPVNLTPKGDAEGVEVAPPGNAIIFFTPGRTAHTQVLLNGQLHVSMVVDTGATDVAIPRRVATKLGIDTDKLRTVQAQTAGGKRTVFVTTLSEVRVGGVVAHNVTCGVMDDRDLGDQGLLGQSFLSRFKTTVDAPHGRIEIATR